MGALLALVLVPPPPPPPPPSFRPSGESSRRQMMWRWTDFGSRSQKAACHCRGPSTRRAMQPSATPWRRIVEVSLESFKRLVAIPVDAVHERHPRPVGHVPSVGAAMAVTTARIEPVAAVTVTAKSKQAAIETSGCPRPPADWVVS